MQCNTFCDPVRFFLTFSSIVFRKNFKFELAAVLSKIFVEVESNSTPTAFYLPQVTQVLNIQYLQTFENHWASFLQRVSETYKKLPSRNFELHDQWFK